MTVPAQPPRAPAEGAVGVVGAGAWGTALALAASRAGRPVWLWARDPAAVRRMREARESPRLPGITLPAVVTPTAELERLRACSVLLLAVPAQTVRALARRLQGFPGAVLVCAKGIERGSHMRLGQVVVQELGHGRVGVLSGPSFAREVAEGRPTALTLAMPDLACARILAARLASPTFRLYPGDDPIGVELAGALKNVIAIAAGAVLGAGLGENARAALITRGLAEMARLVEAEGGRRETLMGLAGLGDLMLTATSLTSRNTRFGYELARGVPLAELNAPGRPLAEGVWTARAALELAARHRLELPITAVVAELVEGRIDVGEAVRRLLARPLPERE